MDSINNTMRELERPPSKSNLSLMNIIQLVLMLLIGLKAGKECYDIFSIGKFSFIDLIEIVIDLLVLVGCCLGAYGLFKDESDKLKMGFMLFFYGLIGFLIVYVLGWFKKGFEFGSLLNVILFGFVAYVLYIQAKNL